MGKISSCPMLTLMHLFLHESLTRGPKRQVDNVWMRFAQMGTPHILSKFGEETESVDHFWTNEGSHWVVSIAL